MPQKNLIPNRLFGLNVMGYFERAELLLGADRMKRLHDLRVIIFGVGGVGSWCAESLVRTGVGHITIVDFDYVAESNVNRQVMATPATVGMPKIESMRKRLIEINPDADIKAVRQRYDADTAHKFDLDTYDYIIDAIDSLECKALLICNALLTDATLFSSMGAARRFDPRKVNVTEFWKVQGCPLARALRQRFKKQGELPQRKFLCVYSDETPAPAQQSQQGSAKAPNGSLMQVTATFGLTLTALIIDDIRRK